MLYCIIQMIQNIAKKVEFMVSQFMKCLRLTNVALAIFNLEV